MSIIDIDELFFAFIGSNAAFDPSNSVMPSLVIYCCEKLERVITNKINSLRIFISNLKLCKITNNILKLL